MLVNTLRWRQEFDVEKAVNEEFPADVFGNLGRIYGHDREGRPNTWVYLVPYTCSGLISFLGFSATTCTAGIRIFRQSSATYNVSFGKHASLFQAAKPLAQTNQIDRWRVQLMEKGVALLDFETVDQMNQVHGWRNPFPYPSFVRSHLDFRLRGRISFQPRPEL